MLNGLSLFSGIGGLDVALSGYIRPIAYCEIDPFCQGILLNNMYNRRIFQSPIWNDVRTFEGMEWKDVVDILYGGFPCQDISVAGLRKGLEGERSGLFFEIMRLAKEIKPKFIFLENVPGILSKGGLQVAQEITEMGYDCRWCVISAASIGAPHKRERWFLLAHAQHNGSSSTEKSGSPEESIRDSSQGTFLSEQSKGMDNSEPLASESSTYASCERCDKRPGESLRSETQIKLLSEPSDSGSKVLNYWEEVEPPVCGVDDGLSDRVDRIKCLGNSVVSLQAKEAFEILMGLK